MKHLKSYDITYMNIYFSEIVQTFCIKAFKTVSYELQFASFRTSKE